MRRFAIVLALLGALLTAPPARAAEEKCPLDVATCLEMFARARERPWLGIEFENDSTGTPHVHNIVPDSPAEKAGVKPGDVIRRIDGQDPRDWFAGKSGWETSGQSACSVLRDGKVKDLKFEIRRMPEEMFARIVGVHMVEGHVAYMEHAGHAGHEQH
jgi:C-terminal processing protease CtpA/Prc